MPRLVKARDRWGEEIQIDQETLECRRLKKGIVTATSKGRGSELHIEIVCKSGDGRFFAHARFLPANPTPEETLAFNMRREWHYVEVTAEQASEYLHRAGLEEGELQGVLAWFQDAEPHGPWYEGTRRGLSKALGGQEKETDPDFLEKQHQAGVIVLHVDRQRGKRPRFKIRVIDPQRRQEFAAAWKGIGSAKHASNRRATKP